MQPQMAGMNPNERPKALLLFVGPPTDRSSFIANALIQALFVKTGTHESLRHVIEALQIPKQNRPPFLTGYPVLYDEFLNRAFTGVQCLNTLSERLQHAGMSHQDVVELTNRARSHVEQQIVQQQANAYAQPIPNQRLPQTPAPPTSRNPLDIAFSPYLDQTPMLPGLTNREAERDCTLTPAAMCDGSVGFEVAQLANIPEDPAKYGSGKISNRDRERLLEEEVNARRATGPAAEELTPEAMNKILASMKEEL